MKEIIAVLHNIRSVHNVSSIFRTADAAGVSKIYLTGITPGPLDRLGHPRKDFVKVSLGAERSVPWDESYCLPRALPKLLEVLRDQGYLVCAIEQSPRSIPYYKVASSLKKQQKIALIMGNEVKGLPPSILRAADKILEIPMYGKKESLNVSVALGIVVFCLRY